METIGIVILYQLGDDDIRQIPDLCCPSYILHSTPYIQIAYMPGWFSHC